MNNKELQEFVEILYPHFKKKLLKDGSFKNCVRAKNATVVSELEAGGSNIGEDVEVILPYDSTSFFVRNETGENLAQGDLIILISWIDLKNAVAIFKV